MFHGNVTPRLSVPSPEYDSETVRCRCLSDERGKDVADESRTRIIAVVYLLAFYCSHGNPLIMPLLPFISQEFSLEPYEAGLMITLYAIPGCFIPFFGMLEDRIGRRPMLYVCLVASMLSAALGALSTHYGMLAFCRFWHGFFTTPLEALVYTLITDHFPKEARSVHVGRATTLLFAGVAVIPLVTTAVQYGLGWRIALLLPSVMGLPIVLLAWKVVAVQEYASDMRMSRYTSEVFHSLFSGPLISLCLVRMMVATGLFGIVYLFLPTIVTDVAQVSPHMVGICFAMISVAMAAASSSTHWHMAHMPPAMIGLYGGVLFAAGLLCSLTCSHIAIISLGLMGCGWVYGLFTAVGTVYYAQLTTPGTRGALMAVYSMLFRASQALGVTAMGYLFRQGGMVSVIGAGVALSVLFSLLACVAYTRIAGKKASGR